MARQIAPGTPSTYDIRLNKVEMPDFSKFEDVGDAQIKAANQNFKLYADTLIKTESAKLYEQYKNDPIQLSNALGKLPKMLSGLPEELRNEMNQKLYLQGVSLVQKAQSNYNKEQNKQTKADAITNAKMSNASIANSFYNMLNDSLKPAEEKSPINKDIYVNDRINLDTIADTIDTQGNPIFTEDEVKSLKTPKDATVAGLGQFAQDLDKKTLDDWKENVFDDKEKFQEEFIVDDETYDSMEKAIEYARNVKEKEETVAENQLRTSNSLAFMKNPIIYRANMSRVPGAINVSKDLDDKLEISKQLEEKASKIYSLADKVGNGKVDPATLQLIIRKVASITIDDQDSSIVDNNILKAYDADLALREAGADEQQLAAFHKLLEVAMTDTAFKQSIAALANKPSFDNMLLDTEWGGRRKTGLGMIKSRKDEDTEYVNKLGKEAYFEAMALISDGKPEEALSAYDARIQQAYDYIKRDIIDVDYVKQQLANMGHAMVELNGNMSKIVGRLPNGEYIIEDTGEKINGGI